MEQVKHGIATAALKAGEQLPGIRRVAEDLVMNPNTVAKAYRELEHEGVIELRHGAGAFIVEQKTSRQSTRSAQALPLIQEFIEKLVEMGLRGDEIRRLLEGELIRLANGIGRK
jgi:GntR family transcriptional regulator